MAFGSSKTSCYLGCQQFSNLWIFVCWLLFCLGFFPLDHCQDGLECLNVASCLSFWFFFCFFFLIYFLLWKWKVIQRHFKQEKSEYLWAQECPWVPRVSMAVHQPTTTAKHLWRISKLSSLSRTAFWMHPQYSVLVLPLINREGLVFQERTVCALKK